MSIEQKSKGYCKRRKNRKKRYSEKQRRERLRSNIKQGTQYIKMLEV